MIVPRDLSGADAPLRPADGTVTLVEGSAFCISGPSGNLLSGGAHGLFFRDTRFLSGFEVRVNGGLPERLTAAVTDPFSAVFVGRMGPTLLVIRHRYVGRGMREDLTVRNYAGEPPSARSSWPSRPTSPTCSRSRPAAAGRVRRTRSSRSGSTSSSGTAGGPGAGPPRSP